MIFVNGFTITVIQIHVFNKQRYLLIISHQKKLKKEDIDENGGGGGILSPFLEFFPLSSARVALLTIFIILSLKSFVSFSRFTNKDKLVLQ